MNIDDLTIKEAKEIANMFASSNTEHKKQIGSDLIGKYVIVRSPNEGINAGYVDELDETGVVLTEARRIWYHRPKNKSLSWYEGVAVSGLSNDSKISCAVSAKAIIEQYSITPCTTAAEESIKGFKAHEQF